MRTDSATMLLHESASQARVRVPVRIVIQAVIVSTNF
jgi:hypothetical protein